MTHISRLKPSRWSGIALGIMLLGCLAAGPAWAAQASEATIFGQVLDESGAVLPGVTVTVTSPALQLKQIVEVTNANGEYRVTPLPLGTYALEFTLPGFQTLRREGIRLTAGFVARVDVSLAVGGLAETITVSGASPVVDVRTTGSGTQITREVLENVSSTRSGIYSLLTMAAGARPRLEEGRVDAKYAMFRAFGRTQEAWITVEGVSTTAPFSGAVGYANMYSQESFEEATVQTLGSPAEAPTAGVQLNILLKSGSNDFHGGALFGQFAKWMQGDNLDDALRAQGIREVPKMISQWDRGGDLGGRIVRDRVWFYGAGRMRHYQQTNLGVPALGGTDMTYLDGKGTVQLTSTQRLIGVYHRDKRVDKSTGPTRRFQIDENSRAPVPRPFHTNVGKGEWQLARGNKVLSVVSGAWWAGNPTIVPPASDLPGWSDQVTGFSGGEQRTMDQRIDWLERWEARSTLNWYKPDLWRGNHDFKLGANFFIANADFRGAVRGNPGDCCYNLVYRSGVPFRVDVSNAPVNPKTRLDYLGLYFQDSWAVNRRLTLNLGVRYANDQGWLPEQCREAAPAPFQGLFPAQCYPEFHAKTWNPIVPRLHAAYDVTGDGRTVIKGGWARFFNLHTQDEMNLANPIAQSTARFRWHGDFNNNRRWDAGESNLALDGPDFLSLSRAINENLAGLVDNPDLEQPGSDELMVSLERELLPNLGLRVTGVYSKNFNTLRVLNTFRPYEAYSIPVTNPDPGPDGRVGTADDPGTFVTYWEYPRELAGAAFQRLIFVNDAASNATYKSIDIAANRRFANRWQLLASYTATRINNPVVYETIGSAGSGAQRGVFSSSLNPNAEINTHLQVWEWQTKLSGSYLFPGDIQVSANFSNLSGAPWARTHVFTGGRTIPSLELRVEPPHARRTESLNWLMLRAEKVFRLRAGHRLSVGGNVVNVLNTNVTTSQSQVDDSPLLQRRSGRTFGYATQIPISRIGEVFLKYSF